MNHFLKIWPPYFDIVASGEKPWELRQNDRNFQVNDTLILHEWEPGKEEYTGRYIRCRVTYILSGPGFGLPEGYCIMTLKDISVHA